MGSAEQATGLIRRLNANRQLTAPTTVSNGTSINGGSGERRRLNHFFPGRIGRRMPPPLDGVSGLNGHGRDGVGHKATTQPEKYPGYRQHPVDVIHMSRVVLPALSDRAAVMSANSPSDRARHMAALVDTYRVISTYSDNLSLQERKLLEMAISPELYLSQVRSMMPALDAGKTKIDAEAAKRSHRANTRNARVERTKARVEMGKHEAQYLPEARAELPLEMMTDLAKFNATVKLFREDFYRKNPEQKGVRTHRAERAHRQEERDKHVNGLLSAAYASTLQNFTDVSVEPVYAEQFAALQSELAERTQKIDEDASGWTLSQQHHEIRRAVKNFTSLDEQNLALRDESGLNQDMVKEASRALVKESAATVVWNAGIEVAQLFQGGAGNATGFGPHLLDTKSSAVLIGAAAGSRAVSMSLLVLKGILAKNLTRLTGVAPDVGTKITNEVSNNPLAGFAGYNGAVEVGFGVYSALGALHGGLEGAVSTELGTNLGLFGIPRQVIEDVVMFVKVIQAKRKQRAALEVAARRKQREAEAAEAAGSSEQTANVLALPVEPKIILPGTDVNVTKAS